MNKVKIGVVGVGHLGSRHAQIYKKMGTCELAGVCDTDPSRLKQVTDTLGVRGFKDYHDLLGKVDAVSIAVPTSLHYQAGREFLEKGIHALIEKPFTSNLRQADKLINIAKKTKAVLQVGHVERFNSAFAATQQIIREPKFIECHRLSPFPHRSLDIGVVLDLMIHDIDIIMGLVNAPIKRIEAVGVPVLTNLEDIANARITFVNGCVCNLTASRVSEEIMRKIRIFQKDTYISLDYKEAKASVYRRDASGITKEDLPIEKEQPLEKELASFIECIAQNKKPLVSGEIAREALKVALTVCAHICKKDTS